MTGTLAWVLVALPAAGAALGALVPGRRAPAWVAVPFATAAAGVAVPLAVLAVGSGTEETRIALAPTGTVEVTAGTLVDGLAGLLALTVALVALAVQVYSVAYMSDDARYRTYAALVSLFTAAMLAVVLSADLLALLIGWEVMGLCSYLLIGHDRHLREAPGAALKAFLVTRVGDSALLVGLLLLGAKAGTFRITGVIDAVPTLSPAVLTTATLLIVAGVCGKSAQFPLHTWLPDAMAGPTPISALIHAATMVAAGVYLVLRLYPVFTAAPVTLAVLATLAAITMLLGALAALGQDDMKRVLAYSTISQLAYMLGALAVGGVAAGAFHLVTHAAFKALLFLCAGVVLHQTGTVSMRRLGGLRGALPVTFGATLVGSVALVGLLPFSGGFSKDAALDAALDAARGNATVAPWAGGLVLASGLLTVVITAAYVTRMVLRTFAGPAGDRPTPREPGWLMRGPVLALAVPAAGLGALAYTLPEWVGVPNASLGPHGPTALVSLALMVVGAGATGWVWVRDRSRDPVTLLGRPVTAALAAGLYADTAQRALVTRPVRALAGLVATGDRVLVDGAVEGGGRGAGRLGALLAWPHRGNAQYYLTGVVAGVVLIAVAVAVSA